MPCRFLCSWSRFPILLNDLESLVPSKLFLTCSPLLIPRTSASLESCHSDPRSSPWPLSYSKTRKNKEWRWTERSQAIVHENCKQARWGPACDLRTQRDRAKTPKNSLLDAKCFMQWEWKLMFQTGAKKCGCIAEKQWCI